MDGFFYMTALSVGIKVNQPSIYNLRILENPRYTLRILENPFHRSLKLRGRELSLMVRT